MLTIQMKISLINGLKLDNREVWTSVNQVRPHGNNISWVACKMKEK